MAAGAWAPAAARTVMTPRGRRVTLEVLMAKKRHMALVAVPGSGASFSSSRMALIPMGVAALPRPRVLAAMFMIMALMAGCSAGTSGKRRTITGLRARAMARIIPPASTTRISPSHRAMGPMRPMARVTALLAASKEALVTASMRLVQAAVAVAMRIMASQMMLMAEGLGRPAPELISL